MSLRSIIIDDEPLAHKIILTYCEDIPDLEIVGQYYLATEATDILQTNQVDLMFLDIQMPKITGLEYLKSISSKPLVIVTSAFEKYALHGYELDICDFLLKPYSFERFLKAVNKAQNLHHLKSRANNPVSATTGPDHAIFIKSNRKLLRILPNDIYFLESYGNYVKIWMKDGFHLTTGPLSRIAQELDKRNFVRTHKSYLVNQEKIDFILGNIIKLKNGGEVPIGKSYRGLFKV